LDGGDAMISIVPPKHLNESEKVGWCLEVCRIALFEARQLAVLHVIWLGIIVAICWRFLADLLVQPVWLSMMCLPFIIGISPHLSRWGYRFVVKVSVYHLILILTLFGFLCAILNIWLASSENLLSLKNLVNGISWIVGVISFTAGVSWLAGLYRFVNGTFYLFVPIFCTWWGAYATILLIFIALLQ
jgi:hypothetical protein